MPSQIQKRLLLALLLFTLDFFFGLRFLHSENYEIFPNCEIKKIDSFSGHHDKLFQIVAYKMKIKINKKLPKPIILTDKQLTPQRFSSYLGWEVDSMFPYYFFKKNILVIPETCKLDSLVHELVHYFQVVYQNEDLDFDCGPYIENLEMEAVTIQRWFKSKYMEPHTLAHDISIKFSQHIANLPQ